MKVALTDFVTGQPPSVEDQQVKKEKRQKIPKAVEAESFQEQPSFSEILNEQWDGIVAKGTKLKQRKLILSETIAPSGEENHGDSNSEDFLEEILNREGDSDDDDPFARLSPRSRAIA